jgi:hypothetical protein
MGGNYFGVRDGQTGVIPARSRLGGHHYSPSGIFQPESVVHSLAESLLAAEITFGGLNRCVSKQELNLLKFPPARWHNRAQVRRKSWGARFLMSARLAAAFTTCQIALAVIPAPQILPSRLTRRKITPPLMPAAAVHSSTARFAQNGTGTVRMCFPLPTRSAMTECSSRPEHLLG